MRRTALALLAVVTLLLGVVGASPATAKPKPSKASVTDAAGEVPAGIDLLSGKYALTSKPKKKVKFQVRVKELTDTTFLAFEVYSLNAGWDRMAAYRENGTSVLKLYAVYTDEDVDEVQERKCKAMRLDWDAGKDTVSVEVPFSCLVVASSASPGAYGFKVFSRFGGTPSGNGDFLRERTLDF